MAPRYTYGGDPANSDRDAVRWYVGDTDCRRPMLDDREVDYSLVQNPNVLIAASVCAEALAGKFARESDVTVGNISKAMSKIADAYKKHSQTLRDRACLDAGVSFPATSLSEKQVLEEDTDLANPQFFVGIGDNPWAVQMNEILSQYRTFNGFCW